MPQIVHASFECTGSSCLIMFVIRALRCDYLKRQLSYVGTLKTETVPGLVLTVMLQLFKGGSCCIMAS